MPSARSARITWSRGTLGERAPGRSAARTGRRRARSRAGRGAAGAGRASRASSALEARQVLLAPRVLLGQALELRAQRPRPATRSCAGCGRASARGTRRRRAPCARSSRATRAARRASRSLVVTAPPSPAVSSFELCIENEPAVPSAPGAAAAPARAVRVRAVLDHGQAVLLGERAERVHVGQRAGQVHRHERGRVLGRAPPRPRAGSMQ